MSKVSGYNSIEIEKEVLTFRNKSSNKMRKNNQVHGREQQVTTDHHDLPFFVLLVQFLVPSPSTDIISWGGTMYLELITSI